MSGDIRALPTQYKGVTFRSRLEARWAIFFDEAAIHWEYERQGYDLGELGNYLPDFWLPQVNMWAEVKSQIFSDIEFEKCRALAMLTRHPVLLLDGVPEATAYWAIEPIPDGTTTLYDHVLASRYLTTENRFYSNTGGEQDYPDRNAEPELSDKDAIQAAMSARFDNGIYIGS